MTGNAAGEAPEAAVQLALATYFDGVSSRRRSVALAFDNDRLEIKEADGELVVWPCSDIRRADGPPGILLLSCLSAPALARLDVRDMTFAAEVIARCDQLDRAVPGPGGTAKIIGWSLAAAVSIVGLVLFGVPLAADRLAPLVPEGLERRLGDVAEKQVGVMVGGRFCGEADGQAAFIRLVEAVGKSAGLDPPIRAAVLASPIANAFALPGGKVLLFNGLLQKAENPDEIAGVLAHEFGHLKHRDSTRNLIHNGGTSFLIGLLFGDITGSGALIFASRSLVSASYSREAEENADIFSIDVMHRLGRPTRSMGELLYRVTGKEGDKTLSILASHPLTEDRLARMRNEDLPASEPPLLSPAEWRALKAICGYDPKL